MTMDDPVRRALAELADADAFRHAPPHLERAILEAFDRHGNEGWLERCAATVWACRREAVAVAVAVGVTIPLYFSVLDRVPSAPRQMSPPAVRQASPHPGTRDERPIEPEIDRTVATGGMSDEGMHSVHVRVPRSFLPLLGVPVLDPDAAGMVNLEVGVTEDGLARTIHVVR